MRKLKLSHSTIVILLMTMLAFMAASYSAVMTKDIPSELYYLAAGICGWNAVIWAIDDDRRWSER